MYTSVGPRIPSGGLTALLNHLTHLPDENRPSGSNLAQVMRRPGLRLGDAAGVTDTRERPRAAASSGPFISGREPAATETQRGSAPGANAWTHVRPLIKFASAHRACASLG